MDLFLKHVQPTKGDGLAIARATMLVKIKYTKLDKYLSACVSNAER
jgi:hypothetical protein